MNFKASPAHAMSSHGLHSRKQGTSLASCLRAGNAAFRSVVLLCCLPRIQPFWAHRKWDPIDSRCHEERKSKEALDQTYIPARPQQAQKLVGMPPMAKTKRWEESLPRGLQMQALCIGVNDYKEKTKLKNAIADAEGIARCIENLPDSSARAVCRNPETKGALEREIKSFLSDLPKERPPQIVLIFYAGHAVQEGNQIFLLPANANPKTQEDLKSMCFSHDELFKLLKVKVDDQIEVEDVLYLVILDACRESLGGISPVLAGFSAESHEPLPDNRPAKWALCTSTARGNVAYDGENGHSPFTEALMSVECGLFKPNVPLEWALKMVCKKLQVTQQQEPCLMPAYTIPGSLCLHNVQLKQLSTEERFDVFLCYRDEGVDRAVAERLKDKLTSCHVETEGFEQRPLRVFLRAGPPPPVQSVQVAEAMHNSTVILLLFSHNTFDGVDALLEDSPSHNRLVQMLWQHEMALELLESGVALPSRQQKLVPLLIGTRSEQSGSAEFERFDEYDRKFWPISKVPDLKVKSIVECALAGLRRDAQVAMGLGVKMLNCAGEETPSIIRGRTLRKTVSAFSAPETWTYWKLEGHEDGALEGICRGLIGLVKELSKKRSREDENAAEGAAPKMPKANNDSVGAVGTRGGSGGFVAASACKGAGQGGANSTESHKGEILNPSKPEMESLSQVNASLASLFATGVRIQRDSRIEVRWEMREENTDFQTIDELEKGIWWPATVIQCVKSHCEKVGGPIWEVKYDESSIQWERRDLVRVVCFCSKDVLLDLQELGHDYGGTGGRCQWRMEGTKQEENSLLTTGTRVKARYRGGKEWFAGTVAAANRDGTYHVLYQDGDQEENVLRDLIQPVAEEAIIAHDPLTFCESFAQIFTSSEYFLSLSAMQRPLALERVARFREPLMRELEKFREQEGHGATVSRNTINNICGNNFQKLLQNAGYNNLIEKDLFNIQPEGSPSCIKVEELDPGLWWRVEGHDYINQPTLRVLQEEAQTRFVKGRPGRIVGWFPREESIKMIDKGEQGFEDEKGPCDMWKNQFDDDPGEREDLEEHEVSQATSAMKEYQRAVQKTEETCGVKVESGRTRLEIFDQVAWDDFGDMRWIPGTIGDLFAINDDGNPMWVIKYDGVEKTSKVSLVAPNTLFQFQIDDVAGLATSDELLTSSFRLAGEDFMPLAAEAAARLEQESQAQAPLKSVLSLIKNPACLETMMKIVRNCAQASTLPQSPCEKYRKLRVANPKIQEMLRSEGAMAAMHEMGWIEDGDFLVLPASVNVSTNEVQDIECALSLIQQRD